MIMTPREFKHGLLRLADKNDSSLISERVVALRLAAIYIDADAAAKAECSSMLRADLAELDTPPP